MTPAAENLRMLLDARDLDRFLEAFETYRKGDTVEPVVTALTQRVFPPLLREAFASDLLTPESVVRLYRLVRDMRLLLVENDLIVGINLRIDEALREFEPDAKLPAPALVTFDEGQPKKASWLPPGGGAVRATEVKRIAVVSAFTIGTWSAVDAFDFRKNVCASQQEREFLRAVRQFFPALHVYPNVPLKNFIDIEKLEAVLPQGARNYAWTSQLDILLCTAEEDPIAGIELDSIHHDTEGATRRDDLKNTLFNLAGVPLVRIRADDTQAVRAEDFYDLLIAEAETLDGLRPRRMRPRRTHDFLVPAEAVTRTRSVNFSGR